jgi:NADP-reducing hydrogenase subunit HndA
MSTKKPAVPFRGTKEQEEQLRQVIAEHQGEKGVLIPILQKAQDIYGYLPIEVQTIISDEIGVPLEKIYKLTTLYSQFSLTPKAENAIRVCLGSSCCAKGAGDIFNRLRELLDIDRGGCTSDGKFSLDTCRCIGACGLAPVMMVNEEVYRRLTIEEIDSILSKL